MILPVIEQSITIARLVHRSTLQYSAYEDLRTARASLLEFIGTRAEDPVRLLANSESVLQQARIHVSGWCRVVEQQLKGAATTWWKSIKVLDITVREHIVRRGRQHT